MNLFCSSLGLHYLCKNLKLRSMAFDLDKVAIVAPQREVTYGQMLVQIGMFAQRLALGEGERCLIFAPNGEGWIYALYAVWMRRGVAVPVDATSTVEDLAYVMKDCGPAAMWTSRTKMDTVEQAMALAGVRPQVLFLDEEDADGKCQMSNGKCQTSIPCPQGVLMMEEEPERTALIIYTSGTTGSPKGVMLSYDNLMANIEGVWKDVPIFDENRRTLILLPVHHVLPLMGTVIGPMICGGGVAICPSLSASDIMETLRRGKVGMMIGVPRLWQTLYKGIKQKIDAHVATRALFWLCENMQSRRLSRCVFKSVRKKMGGYLDYCVSGGAALDVETARGMKTLGLDVLEGYGMTEAAPIIAFTRPDEIRPGCVGRPLPAVECKLVDGELYAKGRNIMQGYYRRPEETAEVLKDGWLRTGDLATMDKDGFVTITGRSKEIIVLSNGKNVNPAELELKLEKYTEQVKEAAVVPDGDKLCAIIVPRPEWAKGMAVADQETKLKEEVLQPYNQSVEPYKKVMGLYLYEGELPRTKLDKLQRFKLAEILRSGVHAAPKQQLVEPTFEEYRLLKQYIQDEKRLTEVRPTDHIETDLAFDSLDKVGLQDFIENAFGLTLTVDALSRFHHVAEMAEYVASYKTRMEKADVDWHSLLNPGLAPDTTGLSPQASLPATWPTGPWIVHTFKTFFKMQFRLASKGTRNIPTEGPFILAANHQSYLDGLFVMSYVRLSQIRNTYFFAKEKHVNTPLRRWLAARHNVVVLEENDMKRSISKLADVLRQGKNIIIFPEGTRTSDGALGEFKKMFAILGVELQVPIVPVVINGAFEALPRGRHWPLPKKIVVEFRPPIVPTADTTYDELTARVKQAIEERLRMPKRS